MGASNQFDYSGSTSHITNLVTLYQNTTITKIVIWLRNQDGYVTEVMSELNQAETVHRTNGYELLKTEDGGALKLNASRSSAPTVIEYADYDTARLAYGLRSEADSFIPCDRDDCVPLAVAKAGKDAIAAYLLTRDPDSRPTQKQVANELDVTEQTIRNYAHRVRWSPD